MELYAAEEVNSISRLLWEADWHNNSRFARAVIAHGKQWLYWSETNSELDFRTAK